MILFHYYSYSFLWNHPHQMPAMRHALVEAVKKQGHAVVHRKLVPADLEKVLENVAIKLRKEDSRI